MEREDPILKIEQAIRVTLSSLSSKCLDDEEDKEEVIVNLLRELKPVIEQIAEDNFKDGQDSYLPW